AKERIISICENIKKQDPNFDYEFNVIMEVEPTIVPDDTDVVNAFLKAGKEYLNRDMAFSLSPGSDDQKYVVKDSKLEQCIVYGPGPLVVAHKVDEYVEVEDMKTSAKIMALAACMLLGVED
ncbi:MAG: M20/M25/M40 family metallo-hydrolase, partial [Tissierellales bacterium]